MAFRIKNGKKFRQAIAEKGYTCRYCDWLIEHNLMSPPSHPAQDPAHIIPRGHGGDDIAANGVELCRKHHNEWDDYKIKMPWSMFTEEEQEYVLTKKGKWWKKIDWNK